MSEPVRVLIVEDTDADVELIRRQLRRVPHVCQLQRVQNEEEFRAALQSLNPHLILSDFSMPCFDGLRALEIARVEVPETPFIFVSGTIGEERAVDALHRGATDYILKSNLSRLASAAQRALSEAELKRARREQEQRLQRLTRTYRMLSSTGSAILRLQDRVELLDEICRIAVQQGGYDRVVLGLIDRHSHSLLPRARAGSDDAALRGFDAAAFDRSVSVAGPRHPIYGGALMLVNDLVVERPDLLGAEVLRDHNYRSFAALPVQVDGTTVAVMTLFSRQADIFDRAEVEVLLELVANLGFALQYLERHEAVQFLSFFDSLTGLAKRPLFCQRLQQRLAEGSEQPGRCVVVFDVCQLGAINDSFGRHIGDQLIGAVAGRLKLAYGGEHGAHLGGGTFALLVDHPGGDVNSTQTSHSLLNAAARLFTDPFLVDAQELRPAVRAGMAIYPDDGREAETLVQAAEAALKAARADNERFMLYGLVRERPSSRTLALEARLVGALERDELLLHYQPKVDIVSGQLTGLEALLRWRDAQEGLVPPSLFVPLLERSGAIAEVGDWIVQQVLRDLRSWRDLGRPRLRVAVNVSPLQLRRRDFVERLVAVLPGAPPDDGIDIEITESMLMQNIEQSMRKLSELREAGVGVAVDDFGTGYSSLRLLARLPVDTLKIDRSFIEGLTDGSTGLMLVSTIVSLARALTMKTVAEGVESAQQLQLLREVRCEQAQGYLFARPVAFGDLPAVLAQLTGARANASDQ